MTDRDQAAWTAHRLAAWREFEAAFRRAGSGNLWCYHEGGAGRLTVFRRGGLYWWCADGDERRYSERGYETEREALSALWEAVE